MNRDYKLWLWGVLCAYAGVAFVGWHWVVGIAFMLASFVALIWAGDE